MGRTNTTSLYADVRLGGRELGVQFCEITTDPYATRDMSVVVHWGDGGEVDSLSDLREATRESERGPLVINAPGLRVQAEAVSLSLGGNGVRVVGKPSEVRETSIGRDGEPVSYTFGYRFPLTSVTRDAPSSASHGRIGLMRGKVTEDDDRFAVEPPPMLHFTVDGVDVRIGSVLDFHNVPSARYPEVQLVTESVVAFELPADLPPQGVISRARSLASAVLHLVSFFERDRLRWSREKYYSVDGEGEAVSQVQTTRWCSPPKERTSLHPGTRRDGLRQITEAFDRAEGTVRDEVLLACGEFAIAATAGDVETSLVRWHSAIDFFCKRAGMDSGSAGQRIVASCDALGVWLSDLADPRTIARLRAKKGGALPFTQLRNAFVHDGFEVFDGRFDELLESRKTARAIAERMLLARLAAGASGSHVGSKEGPV